MITQFWDMHSGGSLKIKPYGKIYIEAPRAEAELVFYHRFGRNPNRVTCTCCGEDYAVTEFATLDAATAFHRGNALIDDYLKGAGVLFISAGDIKPEERVGELPEEGYVWRE